jgi:hypothetical protein
LVAAFSLDQHANIRICPSSNPRIETVILRVFVGFGLLDKLDDYDPSAAIIATPGPCHVGEQLPSRIIAVAVRIRFSNGNSDRVTVDDFFSGLWNLVDNEVGLKWQIVACR